MPRRGASTKAPDANRTDLTLPVTAVAGQEYGSMAEQQVAQHAIPMAAAPVPQGQDAQPTPTPTAAAPAAPAGWPPQAAAATPPCR